VTRVFNRHALTAIREIREMTKADLVDAGARSPAYITQLELGDRDKPSS
jgi:hypothetical protein